ncbi:hypothetical protein AB1Y20_017908 [Prymnesium parvum]|uniref:EF-hand domain-containing protein n=1 Tax=Prymnesium parvum TaxID=97485 RepID=A0AB34JLX6_PRYPA
MHGGSVPVAHAVPVGAQAAPHSSQPSFYSAEQSVLQQWFTMVDTDRSGAISALELQRALSQGGLNYSLKMVASIIRTQAPQGQAQLDFHSFCQVQQLLTHVQQVFGQHDVARTNTLDLERVYSALCQLGYTLDKQPGGPFYTLCQSYDFDMRGLISLDSFVAMVVTLQNARKAFDRFGSDPVPMNYNQFVWAVSQI